MDISAVDICNQAIDRLGAEPAIVDFDEGTALANICKRVYATCRNEVLRAHEWNCAIARATLVAMTAAPVSGYGYQYQLPVSPLCLRVLNMVDSVAEYRIEGDRLLTDEDEVGIRYIQELADTTKYPPYLIELIALFIAGKIAYKIEQSVKQEYEYELRRAKAKNLEEAKQPDPETNTSWTDAGRS
jgi:hypothetical protein